MKRKKKKKMHSVRNCVLSTYTAGGSSPAFCRQYSDSFARLPTAALLESAQKQNKRKINHVGVPALQDTIRTRQKRKNTADRVELWDSGEIGTCPKQRNGTGGVRGERKRSSRHLPSSLQAEGERQKSKGEGGSSARALSA